MRSFMKSVGVTLATCFSLYATAFAAPAGAADEAEVGVFKGAQRVGNIGHQVGQHTILHDPGQEGTVRRDDVDRPAHPGNAATPASMALVSNSGSPTTLLYEPLIRRTKAAARPWMA